MLGKGKLFKYRTNKTVKMTEQKQAIELNKISDIIWEIPKTGQMNVPTRVFATEKMLQKMKQDRTLEQGRNVAVLPGIYKYACIMPDGHEGSQFS